MISTVEASADQSYGQFLANAEVGGAARIALKLAKQIQIECGSCVVWTPPNGRAKATVLDEGLSSRTFNNRPMISQNRVRSLLGNVVLARALRKARSRLIHVHCPFAYAAFRWAFQWSGAVRVVHVHSEVRESTLQWTFRHPPELIVTCAEFLAQHVRESLTRDARGRVRVEAVPNCVDVARFQPGERSAARQAVSRLTDRPVVLMLANLAPFKGHKTAIYAIRELATRGKKVELWCAGVERDGESYTRELQELVAELGISEFVRFLGFRTDAPELLQAADMLLLPSCTEGLPLTILEAQATRIPVIAAPSGGIPEIVKDGETGFLVSAQDARGYANRIEALLDDPQLNADIAERAYSKILADHTWDVYKTRMFQLYEELLA
jgi:glycosyltransferase involved in cell wall biosynthesis